MDLSRKYNPRDWDGHFGYSGETLIRKAAKRNLTPAEYIVRLQEKRKTQRKDRGDRYRQAVENRRKGVARTTGDAE
jgi:Zn-dependent peptidase ImmA (M78 family)